MVRYTKTTAYRVDTRGSGKVDGSVSLTETNPVCRWLVSLSHYENDPYDPLTVYQKGRPEHGLSYTSTHSKISKNRGTLLGFLFY